MIGMQRDKAPVEWSLSLGGLPTEGSVLRLFVWKSTPFQGPLHVALTYHEASGEGKKGKNREMKDWGKGKGGWKPLNKQLAWSKLRTVCEQWCLPVSPHGEFAPTEFAPTSTHLAIK